MPILTILNFYFQLLIALSISDTLLIAFFILTSVCVTLSENEPQWFTIIFSKVLWPLGNICITVSVLLVVAVSTERYLAICRPLQYKPKAVFFIVLVFATSISVNTGRFFEFTTNKEHIQSNESTEMKYSFGPSEIMSDERYIMFSRYWTEIIVTGALPLIALVFLNYGIYSEIRNSAKFRQDHKNIPSRQSQKSSRVRIHSTINMDNLDERNRLNVRASTSSASSVEVSNKKGSRKRSESLTRIKTETIVAITHRASTASQHTTENSEIRVVKTSTIRLVVPSSGEKIKKRSNDRSTQLLVGIVLVFLICHTVRLVIQVGSK